MAFMLRVILLCLFFLVIQFYHILQKFWPPMHWKKEKRKGNMVLHQWREHYLAQ